jgi:sulfur carrier protein ThiS
MIVSLKYQGKSRKMELSSKAKVSDLLKEAEINPETVLIRRSGEIIPETEVLNNKDKLEAIRIISEG